MRLMYFSNKVRAFSVPALVWTVKETNNYDLIFLSKYFQIWWKWFSQSHYWLFIELMKIACKWSVFEKSRRCKSASSRHKFFLCLYMKECFSSRVSIFRNEIEEKYTLDRKEINVVFANNFIIFMHTMQRIKKIFLIMQTM